MIKLLILDVDGVLTDGKKYYNRDGDVVMKTFCEKDLTAIKRFRALGVNVVFLTGDPFNESIAKNRNIPCIVNRKDGKHTDKSHYIKNLAIEYNVKMNEIAYAGDDIFDIEIMKKLDHAYCPMNSEITVQSFADPIDANSGENFVMHLLEQLQDEKLIPTPEFEEHLKKVYELDEKEKF
jgi:3-deoxy-D-manno-octulosonate 8-phosphate phosphatase (KDO 8-P phosphatase)